LQALEILGFFRVRDPAFAVLAGVWNPPYREKKYFRETSARWLGRMLSLYAKSHPALAAKARTALQNGVERETDEALKREITRRLEQATK
jgi:hypothetical protein